jgi:hypothetical protein
MLCNKLSAQHIQFRRRNMTVRLAAQTLSSSVADAIDFLNTSLELPAFLNSKGTVNL